MAVPPWVALTLPPGGRTSRMTTSPPASRRRWSLESAGWIPDAEAVTGDVNVKRASTTIAIGMVIWRSECRTRRPCVREYLWALVLALAIAARADAAPTWPPFLPEPASFSPGIVASVERVWAEATFHRTVIGAPVDVPFRTYVAFVDAPDVTAAAARHLKLAGYEVHMLDDEWYQADDHAGAQGMYRVLAREHARRVILSWGTHSGH